MEANKITKNEIKFSKNYIGSKEVVKAINFKAVETDTTISEYKGDKQRSKINSDGCIHLMPAFEQYLNWKSAAMLPVDMNLSFKEIERAKRFYTADESWFSNSSLSKSDRDNLVNKYEEIRLAKKRPAEEKSAERRKEKYAKDHRKPNEPVYEYDPMNDIEKYGSFSVSTKF